MDTLGGGNFSTPDGLTVYFVLMVYGEKADKIGMIQYGFGCCCCVLRLLLVEELVILETEGVVDSIGHSSTVFPCHKEEEEVNTGEIADENISCCSF